MLQIVFVKNRRSSFLVKPASCEMLFNRISIKRLDACVFQSSKENLGGLLRKSNREVSSFSRPPVTDFTETFSREKSGCSSARTTTPTVA